MKRIRVLFLVVILPAILLTQPTEEWVARYNGPGNGFDAAASIVVDKEGNVYVTGESWGWGTHLDYATIKYDRDGNELWVARYDEPRHWIDIANSIAVDNAGNVYVTGTSWGWGTSQDYTTIKYDRDGNELWVARYNGPENGKDRASSIAVDNKGNVYVTGYSLGLGIDSEYATVKYDRNGVQKWVARYHGPGSGLNVASSIAVDNKGNVYVTGYSEGLDTNRDYATIKYDRNGNQQWVARYNGPGNDRDAAYSIAVDNEGNVYVTGGSTGSGTHGDYATIKYDQNGNELWVARYNGPGNSWGMVPIP